MQQDKQGVKRFIMLTISAVIPTYNGTRYLAEAIKSVLRQTYEVLEIIVVDDGSRENIEEILTPFAPKVTYVRQENAGPAAARNHGISLAKGDVIALLDDDDIWHPTKTAEQVKRFIENPNCALVYSDPDWIDENGRRIPHEIPAEFPSGRVYEQFLAKNWVASPSVTLIKRDIFNDIGLFDEQSECISCEDYELWLRIAKDYDVVFCPGNLASYRVRESGISRNLDRHLNAHLYVFSKLAATYVETEEIGNKTFYAALQINRYNTMRRFAYGYYYMSEDRDKARSLLRETLRERPWCLKDMLYFAALSMPPSLLQILRKTKQRISASFISLRLARKPT